MATDRLRSVAADFTAPEDFTRTETRALHAVAQLVADEHPEGFATRADHDAAFLAAAEQIGGPELREYARWVQEPRLADVDLEQLRQRLAASIEKAKQDDPKLLRDRIAQLERDLAHRPTETKIETKLVEVPVVPPAHRAALGLVTDRLVAGLGILRVLVERYPEHVERTVLADLVEASATSSAYANNLGALRSLGLIDYPARGWVVATPLLFPEGVPA